MQDFEILNSLKTWKVSEFFDIFLNSFQNIAFYLPKGGLMYFWSSICETCKMAQAKPRTFSLCLLTNEFPESRLDSRSGDPGLLWSRDAASDTILDSNGVLIIDFPPQLKLSHCLS